MRNSKIRLIDVTLREGIQAPGVSFDLYSSIAIARALRGIRVGMIECGHAAVGFKEQERIRAIVGEAAGIPVLVHARDKREDVRAVASTNASWVGIFAGVNSISQTARYADGSVGKVVFPVKDTVNKAKSLGSEPNSFF